MDDGLTRDEVKLLNELKLIEKQRVLRNGDEHPEIAMKMYDIGKLQYSLHNYKMAYANYVQFTLMVEVCENFEYKFSSAASKSRYNNISSMLKEVKQFLYSDSKMKRQEQLELVAIPGRIQVNKRKSLHNHKIYTGLLEINRLKYLYGNSKSPEIAIKMYNVAKLHYKLREYKDAFKQYSQSLQLFLKISADDDDEHYLVSDIKRTLSLDYNMREFRDEYQSNFQNKNEKPVDNRPSTSRPNVVETKSDLLSNIIPIETKNVPSLGIIKDPSIHYFETAEECYQLGNHSLANLYYSRSIDAIKETHDSQWISTGYVKSDLIDKINKRLNLLKLQQPTVKPSSNNQQTFHSQLDCHVNRPSTSRPNEIKKVPFQHQNYNRPSILDILKKQKQLAEKFKVTSINKQNGKKRVTFSNQDETFSINCSSNDSDDFGETDETNETEETNKTNKTNYNNREISLFLKLGDNFDFNHCIKKYNSAQIYSLLGDEEIAFELYSQSLELFKESKEQDWSGLGMNKWELMNVIQKHLKKNGKPKTELNDSAKKNAADTFINACNNHFANGSYPLFEGSDKFYNKPTNNMSLYGKQICQDIFDLFTNITNLNEHLSEDKQIKI
jgi:tetratricopeptide (TPR) repeat protein